MYGADLPLDHVIQLLHEFATTSSDAGTTESELNQVEIGNVTINSIPICFLCFRSVPLCSHDQT